jgi:6-phosphogluconolactonase (cycloisomerase 2 family)
MNNLIKSSFKQRFLAILLATTCTVFALENPVLAAPSNPELFVIHNKTNKLTEFLIDPATGHLTPFDISGTGAGYLLTGAAPGDITILSNKFIYVASWYQATISMYSINTNSTALPLIPPVVNLDYSSPGWSTSIDPSNTYAYSAEYYAGKIDQFRIDQISGALIPIDPPSVTAEAGITGVGLNPLSTPYLYVANTLQNNILVYNFGIMTGQLTKTGFVIPTGGGPRGVWFDNQNHAYVLNDKENTVSMYRALPNGNLEPIYPKESSIFASYYIGNKITTGAQPVSLAIDQDASSLYVAGEFSNTISMYKINKDGLLEPLLGDDGKNIIATGASPRSMRIDNYKHLYLSTISDNKITTYNINSTNGRLSFESSIDAGPGLYMIGITN